MPICALIGERERSAGGRYRTRSGKAARCEYTKRWFILHYTHTRRFAFGGGDSRLWLTGRYEKRTYRIITPSIGEVRDDDRYHLEAEWEVPINDHLFVETRYEFASFVSNLPTADFNEHFVSGRIGVRF